MKNFAILLTAILLSSTIRAQEDMPEVWSVKLDHSIDFYGCDNLGTIGYGYVASDKEISVYENSTGKIVWTKAFKELAPRLKKIDDIIGIWEAKKIFLLDLKMGNEQIAVIDMLTGKLEWDSDQYKIKVRDMITYIPEEDGFLFTFKDVNVFVKALTGEELWSTQKFKGKIGQYVYGDDGMLTAVNFVPEELLALVTGFKNQIAKINMKTGEIIWENTYIGRADRKVISKEWLFSLKLMGDAVVLQLDGLQIYDYKSGAQLWNAAFVYEKPLSKPINASVFGVYGAVPDPVFTDTHVYVVDMSGKSKQFVKKYDRKTGKLVWTSQEISGGARVIPNLYVVDNKVLLQIGGIVEVQGVFKESQTNSAGQSVRVDVKKIYDESVKPYGVQAFNDEDGRLIWESENFKKGITNMFVYQDENLIVSSGKALYSLKIHGGDVNYEVEAKNGGVGDVVLILDHKEKVVVVGEKGVSTFKVSDGSLIAASKYKRASVRDYFGDFLVLETPTQDFAAFNVADGCKYWKYNAKKDSASELTTDGEFIYLYEKKTITKLKSHGS